MKKYSLRNELKINKSIASKIAILLIRGERNKYMKYIVKPFRVIILNFMFNTEIPPSADIGYLLRIPHPYNIIIHNQAKIGIGCTIYHNVTIGANDLSTNYGAPKIGDYCFIGTGGTVIGKIQIGNNVMIGANTVITKSVKDNYFLTISKSALNNINIEEFIKGLV